MLPPATATELETWGHDAIAIADSDLAETDDEAIYLLAVEQARIVVTENFADFATLLEQRIASEEPCVPIVFVRKRDFPHRGALAARLARHLHGWAQRNPDPYPGLYWP